MGCHLCQKCSQATFKAHGLVRLLDEPVPMAAHMEQCSHNKHLPNNHIHWQLGQHLPGGGEFLSFRHGTLVLEGGERALDSILGGWLYEGESGGWQCMEYKSYNTLAIQCTSDTVH